MTKLRLKPRRRILVVGLTLSLVILCATGTGWLEFKRSNQPFYATLSKVIDQFGTASYLNDLARLILFYDEVLTQSARNYAFTKDIKWKRRYLASEPELNKCISSAVGIGGKEDARLFKSIDSANQALDCIERQSIAYVDSGRTAKAIALLESVQYWRNKDIYRRGLEQYSSERGFGINEALKVSNRNLTAALNFDRKAFFSWSLLLCLNLAFILIGVCFIGALMIRFLRTEDVLRESQERFKSIFEGSNDALMLLNEKGFFDCNQRTLEMFGFKSKEEFLRVYPADISPPNQPDGSDSFPASQEKIGEAFRSGSNRFEWIHRKTTGEDFPAEVLLSAFTINRQQVLQATVRDISQRKKAEKSLAESEKSFRNMFELTSDGAALINPYTHHFIAANPAMCSMFGYTEQEFLNLITEDITPPEAREIMRNSMKLLYNGEILPDHEGISLKKDGTRINVLVCCRLLTWKGEQVSYVTFKDITFLKDIQHRLEDKNREILEFTNSVTHDLKKPLSVMKTVASLATVGAFGIINDEGKEALKMGAEAGSYMRDMLDDLLALARLEAGDRNFTIEEFDLHALALEVVGRLKYLIEEKNVTVVIEKELGAVKADKKEIAKVYMNLIGNAINYIGEDPGKKIEAGVNRSEGKNIYFVRDSGIGIPEDTQKTLFQKFKRGSNVTGISGTGLGLSIVKGIIEAHGGKIWVESSVNRGTTFYFTIPQNA